MTRLQWMTCWDRLRKAVVEGQTSWGKNQLLSLIDSIEREEVRKAEEEPQFLHRSFPPEERA